MKKPVYLHNELDNVEIISQKKGIIYTVILYYI
jgi:hypothetical protein